MIIRLRLGIVGKRVMESYSAHFSYTDTVVRFIFALWTEVDAGARNVDHILHRSLSPELASRFLGNLANNKWISSVTIDNRIDCAVESKN